MWITFKNDAGYDSHQDILLSPVGTMCVLFYWNQMLALNIVFSSVPHSELFKCYPAPSPSSLSFHKKTNIFQWRKSSRKERHKGNFPSLWTSIRLFSTNSAVFSCLCEILLDKRDCYCISLWTYIGQQRSHGSSFMFRVVFYCSGHMLR